MNFSLKAPDGTVIESYVKDHREFIQIAGMEYEVHSPIDDLDADPEIRQMIEASEKEIRQGKVFSTDELIENLSSN
ncbi:hypothetical protein [Cohnella sp. GCM10027633]|uniref:hypothetical protein n=1 Tax=unclassified Cohnella TaxID=2636738 RepID=UPI00362EE4FC